MQVAQSSLSSTVAALLGGTLSLEDFQAATTQAALQRDVDQAVLQGELWGDVAAPPSPSGGSDRKARHPWGACRGGAMGLNRGGMGAKPLRPTN